ncbi:MAG: GNAT family N-acetyltransferase [Butyrivibrio sp.]|nr:GNAT family N-acetyltransferase [Butyrivibrio sp.]
MAYIEEIIPGNLQAFDLLIPDVLKKESVLHGGFHFYGISESDEAVGCVITEDRADTAQIRYLYIAPFLRGSGVMDQMLMTLFLELRESGYGKVAMDYIPGEYEVLTHMSRRLGFTEDRMDLSFFRFKAEDIKKCAVASYDPRGIIRMKYLPEDKKERLFKMIDKSFSFYDFNLPGRGDILPYSMVYLESEQPRGALIVQSPSISVLPATEDIKRFPEPGSLDLTLFFVGTTTLKAPLYLLSGLCRVIRKEIDDKVIMTGYFPEGHVSRLLEGTLGIRGSHEVRATLNLSTI